MIAFLADENISPETAAHLQTLGHSCHSLRQAGPWRLKDQEIVTLAQREGRIIVTHDLDFGQIYHLTSGGQVGVIVLRLKRQTVEAVNEVLTRFLASGVLDDESLHRALIVVSERWYRVYRGSRREF